MIGRTSCRLAFVATLFVVMLSSAAVSSADPAVEEGFVTTHDGYRLHYRKVGDGGEAVLIPIDVFTYDGLSPLARPNRTLIFYDPRNRGRSEAVSDLSTITVENDVRDMETLRRHFKLKKLSLIGYSVYGMETALYAAGHPKRVSRLVQLGPVPLKFGTEYPADLDNTKDRSVFDELLWKKLEGLRAEHKDETEPKEYCRVAWEFYKTGLVTTPQALERLRPTIDRMCDYPNEWPVHFRKQIEAHFEGSVAKLDVPWSRLTSRLTMPVLTIHGRKDRNAPYGAGREWASRLPDARLLTLDNAAHQSWVDEPEIVLGAIDEFLDGRWPKVAIDLGERSASASACRSAQGAPVAPGVDRQRPMPRFVRCALSRAGRASDIIGDGSFLPESRVSFADRCTSFAVAGGAAGGERLLLPGPV